MCTGITVAAEDGATIQARTQKGMSAMGMAGRLRIVVATVVFLALAGCGLQPKIIQQRHWDLNEAIRQTTNEQLLLNIVRLRYDEEPYFLQMTSITTSFSAGVSVGASGTFPEHAPNTLFLDAGVAYSETPTVTWALPDSREFLGRLHAPMGADQLAVLAQSGLDLPLVFRMGIKKMNRLRNQEFNVQKGLFVPPTYDEFIEALSLIEELRREDQIDIAYGVYVTNVGGNMAREQMDTRAMSTAIEFGVQYMTLDDPNVFEMLRIARPAFVRFSKSSDDDPRARRLRELLSLDPEKYTFGIIDTGVSSKETLAAARQKVAPSRDDNKPLPEIVLNNRSVMEVLRFASGFVDIPPDELARGVVRERKAPRPEWLKIRASEGRPENAWLKIKRGGAWYYIAEDDLTSRISFTLLGGLFSSVVGEVPGSKPLLTLPVK